MIFLLGGYAKKGCFGAFFTDKIGDTRKDDQVNARIDTIRARVMQAHRQMELDGERITAQA
ncbi:MAG: hypothetical protein LBM20_01315 [Rikenellaceae bacterium]|nr:hypothetical protein [Rikenellaceae bacterium]